MVLAGVSGRGVVAVFSCGRGRGVVPVTSAGDIRRISRGMRDSCGIVEAIGRGSADEFGLLEIGENNGYCYDSCDHVSRGSCR